MLYATHADIRTCVGRKLSSRSALYLLHNAPLPRFTLFVASVDELEPRYIFGARPLDQ